MSSSSALREPFPTEILPVLNFGKADGRLDHHLEDAFVITKSTKKFFQNAHSIIIGPMGAGKSALFELVKTKSNVIPVYKNYTIISIEESISFTKLNKVINDLSDQTDQKFIYQLIWKFHIAISIAEKVSSFPDFPEGKDEKEINDFLQLVNSKEYDESILGKFVGLLKNSALKLKTKISFTPVTIEASVEGSSNSNNIVNLDRILNLCIKTTKERKLNNILVLIDRIDRFVAGEEYDVQRKYIEALLEVDDDLAVSFSDINRKIFLRDDLFARLNYESLGYDKVNDNTLRLEWTNNELAKFLAKRIYIALKKEKLLSTSTVILSTDLSNFNLEGLDGIRTVPFIPLWLKKKILDFDHINKERDVSLSSHLDKSVITKVFPRKLHHRDSSGKEIECCFFEFIFSHFKDGHNKVTPRNLLCFLKEVVEMSGEYYDKNPDQIAHVKLIDNDYEWTLFKEKCVYNAYLKAKTEFIRNISKVENEWTRYFSTFLGKRGNKKTFDFNWMKAIINLEDEKVISFIAYLEHIGFLMADEVHPDPKRRTYRLPMIYMQTPKYN